MVKKPFEIVKHPNPVLRKRAEDFDVSLIKTPDFQAFCDQFGETMKKDGVGLAAPQIGLSQRIISVLENGEPHIYINPEILKSSSAIQESEEGCLSIPGVWGIVDRAKSVRIGAYDRRGRRIEFNVSNFLATVFQHEIDHLDGILFIDKAKRIL